jgi:hypothetical protein
VSNMSEHVGKNQNVLTKYEVKKNDISKIKGGFNRKQLINWPEEEFREIKNQFKIKIIQMADEDSYEALAIGSANNKSYLKDLSPIKFLNRNPNLVISNPQRMQMQNNSCTDFCKKKILMCDDEDFNLMILQAMLDEINIDSVVFLTGEKAVQCF